MIPGEFFFLSKIGHHESNNQFTQKSKCKQKTLQYNFSTSKLFDWNLKSNGGRKKDSH